MNKDKRNNIQLLGTLNNADESGIIANANQIYDANEDKSTQDVSKEHTERIETLETKESSMQTTLENITKTGEASAASNVTYNHNDSKLDATNMQQAIDEVYSKGNTNRENDKTELEKSISDNKTTIDNSIQDVYKKSNYNDGETIIDFNTIHLITDNPEYICVAVDADEKILYGIKTDGQPYFGVGCPQQVKDYIDEQINKILGTNDITTTIDSLKEIEAFLKDFTNSDTLKALLDTKANKIDVDNAIENINANIANKYEHISADIADKYKKSNPNDSEGNVVDTNTIFSIEDNNEYLATLTDNVGKLIEAIGLDGTRKFFAGIEVQGVSQCLVDNPEYIAVWIDNQGKIIFAINKECKFYFGCGIPPQIEEAIENINVKKNSHTYIIAANDSSKEDKRIADYVCDGKNDEEEIQEAINRLGKYGTIYLSVGNYKIESFNNAVDESLNGTVYYAIRIPSQCTGFTLRGFHVSNRYKDTLPTLVLNTAKVDTTNQIGCIGFDDPGRNASTASINGIRIELNYNKPIIGISCFWVGGIQLKNINIFNYCNNLVQGMIGIRGQNVNPNGVGQLWKDLMCRGFYEAFQVGGEHLIIMDCLGYHSHYAYTFGNYEADGWGVWEHPITLINCSEEQCDCLPLFANNGRHNSNSNADYNNKGYQMVDFISHTMELRKNENPSRKDVEPAEETVPGTWCGHINFVGNKESISSQNAVDIQWWKKGSGERFTTINGAHKKGGTTAERLTYTPMYMQTYFDTDLNKLVLFNGENWIDTLGRLI